MIDVITNRIFRFDLHHLRPRLIPLPILIQTGDRLRTNFCDIRLPLLCFLDLVSLSNTNGVQNTKISNWSARITFTKHIYKLSESTVRKLYCARLKVNKFKYTVGGVLSNHPCVNKFVRAVPAHTTKHYASVCEPGIITRFPSFPLKCAP